DVIPKDNSSSACASWSKNTISIDITATSVGKISFVGEKDNVQICAKKSVQSLKLNPIESNVARKTFLLTNENGKILAIFNNQQLPNIDKINDLVERRNQIAHGSEEVDDILSISELEPYIQFLEKYCQAIFQTLFEELIKQESIHIFQKIENVINTYGNKVLAFELENYTIKVGDMLIVETKESRFYKKPILTIELDKTEYRELTIIEKTSIGVSVEPKIKNNQTFYIIKK
ncbi:MAG: hypothetical protein RLZZ86_1396, partial [Cyanobacteriota bacterium]